MNANGMKAPHHEIKILQHHWWKLVQKCDKRTKIEQQKVNTWAILVYIYIDF